MQTYGMRSAPTRLISASSAAPVVAADLRAELGPDLVGSRPVDLEFVGDTGAGGGVNERVTEQQAEALVLGTVGVPFARYELDDDRAEGVLALGRHVELGSHRERSVQFEHVGTRIAQLSAMECLQGGPDGCPG